MSPFEAYNEYLAIKAHFTRDTYDYIKYNGRSKASFSSFEKRKDKYQFAKLAKHRDPKSLIISCMLDGNPWVGDLIGSEANQKYLNREKRLQSLAYTFKSDLEKLLPDFNDNLTITDGEHPHLLKLYVSGEITPETLAIILDLTGANKLWNKRLDGDPLWEPLSLKFVKYVSFVPYEKDRFKKILVDTFKSAVYK